MCGSGARLVHGACPAPQGCSMQWPKPPGRSLMNVRGDAASRGMTAHDRIRLTGPFAEYHPRRQRQAVGATNDSPVRVASQPGLTIYSGSPSQRRSLLRANALPLPTRRRAGLLYHQSMLRVKLLDPAARAPVVAHPGEDLGYFLYLIHPSVRE